MNLNQMQEVFSELGANFLIPIHEIENKLKHIKAFVFDWDGVFNSAEKNESGSSNFNEADSMGTNLLRFSHFLTHAALPQVAIISGENNKQSFYFTRREHFQSCYFKIPHKIEALNHFCVERNLNHNEVCYFFDDVLDLSIAEKCGLRILINRKAGVLFKNYIIKNKLADYVTANSGGAYGVREACELLIGCYNNFDEVIKKRTDYDVTYQNYLNARNSNGTNYFSLTEGKIISQNINF